MADIHPAPANQLTAAPPPVPPEPMTCTVQLAMALSGLGQTTLFALIKSGKLSSVRVEGRRLVHYASLKRLLNLDKAA